MHILIDKLRLYLGIHNLLLGIQPVIAGKHVADRTAECIICHSMKAEHLNAEHDGRKRQFVTPQNTAAMPSEAANGAESPSNGPATQPKVAPMKKEAQFRRP